MDELTERMKTCLVTIETDAVGALRDQPDDADANRRHLNKALALIELRAYTARRGDVARVMWMRQAMSGHSRDLCRTACRPLDERSSHADK